MSKFNKIIFRLSGGNPTVFGIMTISAVWLILVRLLGPVIIKWDLGIQLEAAYRFTRGLGLTNAFSSQLDLNQPPISEYLTHFPPGFSLLVATFLFFNIPLAIALKIIYGSTTIIGWMGWSVIGSRCLTRPLIIGTKPLPIHLILAAILPIFYTPTWTDQGTDIFLWAGVPIVALLLSCFSRTPAWLLSTVLSGFIFGLLLSFRYASAFLAIAALLIIIYVDFPRVKLIIKRCVAFFLSCSLPVIPMAIYIKGVSQAGFDEVSSNDLLQTHGARYLDSNLLESISKSLEQIFSTLVNLPYLADIPVRNLPSILESHPPANYLVGSIFLCFVLYSSWMLVKYHQKIDRYKMYGELSEKNVDILLVCLLIAFILFSVALTFAIGYSPLFLKRYYLPVQPASVFMIYKIATLIDFNQFLKQLSMISIAAILLSKLFLVPASLIASDDKNLLSLFLPLFSTRIAGIDYPSNKVLTPLQDSLNFLIQIESQEPDALFFLQPYPLYMDYINFRDPLKFRRISDNSFWKNAYLSEPTQVFWVVYQKCPLICASSGNFNSDDPEDTIPSLSSLPNLTTVFESKYDKTKIMVSDLPAGYTFDR